MALVSAVILTLAFGALAIGGADGVAFVPLAVGLVLATFLLTTARMPNPFELVLWWIATAAVVVFTGVVTSSAVAEVRSMSRADSCVLIPLNFDNDSVATLQVEWWPPRVQCLYGYSYQHSEEVVWESRWWVYWPAGFVPLSGLLLAGAARQTWRRRETLRAWLRGAPEPRPSDLQ